MKGKYAVKLAVLSAILFCCAACRKPAVLYDSSREDTEAPAAREEEAADGTEAYAAVQNVICVYVCGEVENPGVYELPEGARIADAVEAAGGMTETADRTYLNLAEHLSDGQKIEVLSGEEASKLEEAQIQQQSTLVNLNTASAEQLMTLTGIGESKAKDILTYREKNGSFSKIEELMEIPGIKEGVFQKIKDQITV